jgi:hypothetical protein
MNPDAFQNIVRVCPILGLYVNKFFHNMLDISSLGFMRRYIRTYKMSDKDVKFFEEEIYGNLLSSMYIDEFCGTYYQIIVVDRFNTPYYIIFDEEHAKNYGPKIEGAYVTTRKLDFRSEDITRQ